MVWYPPRIITTYAYLQKLIHHKIHDLKNKKVVHCIHSHILKFVKITKEHPIK